MAQKKYFLKQISNYAMVGGLGSLLLVSFTGCGDRNNDQQNSDTFTQASQKEGAFVIIEKNPNGYQIVDEFPSNKTTIVLREEGKERILTQGEIDKLVASEATKIDNGTSGLTNPEMSSGTGGLSLGEALLASAAGAIIGSYIGSKLFNNQNYQNQRRTSYKSPQTFSRSVDSFKKNSATNSKTSSSKKSGFFGGGTSSRSTSSFGG